MILCPQTPYIHDPFLLLWIYNIFKAVGTPVIWMKKWRLMRAKVLPAPFLSWAPSCWVAGTLECHAANFPLLRAQSTHLVQQNWPPAFFINLLTLISSWIWQPIAISQNKYSRNIVLSLSPEDYENQPRFSLPLCFRILEFICLFT